MRVPYIVGRWVRNENHYGRQRLFTYLLNTPDTAVWAVGARRIGKTSLLRQLEFLTDTPASTLTPLYWDMQGCENSGDLSAELYVAVEDERQRFEARGIAVTALEGLDAPILLRRLGRALATAGAPLLLLVDEAEVLINIARRERRWLARLHRVLQVGHLRTVITSTKLLAQLNQIAVAWETTPFLFGFNMVNLWSLDADAAVDLICQSQSQTPVEVDPVVLEDILVHTNRHPYLMQFLCQRLYYEGDDGTPMLRTPEDDDLEPDHLLAGFFMIDFQQMTHLERRILLKVSEHTVLGGADIFAYLADEPPSRIRTFLWGLEKLGHLRLFYDQWAIGNEYLRRWLIREGERLRRIVDTPLDDRSFEELLEIGYAQENQVFNSEVQALEARYTYLRERQRQIDGDISPELTAELDEVTKLLSAVRRDLSRSTRLG
jgi:hypothetical protein